jgi:hypothetical protein
LPATIQGRGAHDVAGLQGGDRRAYLQDLTGILVPQNSSGLHPEHRVFGDMKITAADATATNLQQDAVTKWLRIVEVDQSQRLVLISTES